MSQSDIDAEFDGGGGNDDERQQHEQRHPYPPWQQQHQQQYRAPSPYHQQHHHHHQQQQRQESSQPPKSYYYPSLQMDQQQQRQHQQQHDFQQWYAQQQGQQQQQPPPSQGASQRHGVQIPTPMILRNPMQTPQYPPVGNTEAPFPPPSVGHVPGGYVATPGGRDGAATRGNPGGGGGRGGFGTFGHTPMTAASFGSSIGAPTPEQQHHHHHHHHRHDDIQHGATGGAPSFVGGHLGPLTYDAAPSYGAGPPTSLPSPFPHQQPRQQQQQRQQQHFGNQPPPSQHQQHRRDERQEGGRLPSVKEEEDPSMLRYESRPGLDTSPMAEDNRGERRVAPKDDGGVGGREDEVAGGTTVDETSRGGKLGTRTPMPPSGHSRRVSSGQDPKSASALQDSKNAGTPSSFAGQTQRMSFGDLSQQADQTGSSNPGMLQEFPFFFDGYAAWVCRHCHHVPSYYRGGNYVWQSSQPPPNHFVDMHLRFCPGLNPANLPPPAAIQPNMPFHPPPQEGSAGFPYPILQQNPYMPHAQVPMFQQESLAMQSYGSKEEIKSPGDDLGGAPDPPGLSPLPPNRQISDRAQGDKTGAIVEPNSVAVQPKRAPHHGAHRDYPSGGNRPYSFQPPYPYHPYPSHMMQIPHVSGESFPVPHPSSAHHGGGDVTMELSPSRNMKKRKASPNKTSPIGRHADDATYKASKHFLTKKTLDSSRPSSEGSDLGMTLVDPSDADLLTDYFFHMLQQLVVCRFSEKDRKTRGGKRENIMIGYGGLQCIHCIDAPSARKFFWSTVDRLANSFAEIPSHILKCKLCPSDVRDALLVLKGRHHDQMQLLPRGSQKVFFRRMWRRLHDRDSSSSTPVRIRPSVSEDERGMDPPPSTLASPDSALPAAASLLAMGANFHLPQLQQPEVSDGIPEKKHVRVLLAIPEDKDWLSDMDCYVRKNIEVFTSTQYDVKDAAADRKYPIKVGQVGIRCVHCAKTPAGARSAAVSYPYSISGIYESVREFQRMHLETCLNVPKDTKQASVKFGGGSASLSSVLRRYYVQAARALGLFDTQDDGIGAGKPVPMPTTRFQSPAPASRPSANDAPGTAPDDENKRKSSPGFDDGEGPKMKRFRLEDAPGTASKHHDAPAKDDVPGMEDAPGEIVTIYSEKKDAPGDKAADSPR